MMAVGRPSADEVVLLESFRGKVPDEVFGDPFVPPVSDGSGQDRVLLRKASALLHQAGFVIKDGKRVTPKGEPISVEFLLDSPSLQPHHMPFIKNLGTLGIEANLRLVDPVQYRKRVDDFDFDLTVQRFGFSSTPGDSLRSYFSSQAAAIGFRTGTRPRTGSPIGTCSAGPRPNRATRAASPRPGGTMARRQQRSIAKPAVSVGTLLLQSAKSC
jgi:ABC-type oligopeptide transport system substrate-binding subunit